MKRCLTKLAIRRETIRALATLDLARAVGGDPALVAQTDTCKEMCTVSLAIKPTAGG